MVISLLQWNIWYKESIKNIASFLLQNKADIICLQELMHNFSNQEVANTTQYLADKLGYKYYEKSISIEGESWQQANGILTHFPIVQQGYSWINEPISTEKSYDNEHRAYVETMLNINGTNLTVGTTHMSYTDGLINTKRKQAEADRLVNIIERKNSNYILTGDFNATPDSYTIQHITKYLKNIGPGYEKNTWTTKPFSHKEFTETDLNRRLDYVFATKDIHVKKAKILSTEYSDHLPIFTELMINTS
ncbi:hypothetical protein COY17_03600 [Candidatus Saccharibacteria bacterium CG_4_10_14_0_2_um_filter_52_9]|nr:MAG: hypothetical protein COY17_03600 [Candidatus Saccharibacteria bacterium CG_4_10_14_0_2_um_filter_52_9]